MTDHRQLRDLLLAGCHRAARLISALEKALRSELVDLHGQLSSGRSAGKSVRSAGSAPPGRCTTLYLMARLMVCSWIGFSA